MNLKQNTLHKRHPQTVTELSIKDISSLKVRILIRIYRYGKF